MVRGKQKGDCSINDDHNITVKGEGEELYCKKVFFHFLLINQVQQLQHGARVNVVTAQLLPSTLTY